MPIEAITLGNNILVTKDKLNNELWLHEFHHIQQMQEYGVFTFYLTYILYYFTGLIRYKDHYDAYYLIPYEIDAYRVQQGLTPHDVRLLRYKDEFQRHTGSGALESGDKTTNH
jgi:hypothetical protein